MSAIEPILDAPVASRKLTVSSPLLLSLYSIIPLSLLAVFADMLIFDSGLKSYLPNNPASLLWWAIIFNFPHIISSLITLADREYITHYKKRFSKALLIIVAGVLLVNIAVPFLAPKAVFIGVHGLFLLFFSGYTMYHVLSQQFGIGMMLMRKHPGKHYEWWRWLSTIATTVLYALIFAKPNLQVVNMGDYSTYTYAQVFAGVFVALAVIVGFYFTRTSKRQLGTMYVYSNLLMLIVTYSFMALGYDFLVIAIPRFVHDLTAFIIYSTHDQNRNNEVKHNYFYRALAFLPISPLVLCPILAIIVANMIECGSYLSDIWLGFNVAATSKCAITHFYAPVVANGLPLSMQIGIQIMFICTFFHYYIEGFVWKRESIHRHAVSFS